MVVWVRSPSPLQGQSYQVQAQSAGLRVLAVLIFRCMVESGAAARQRSIALSAAAAAPVNRNDSPAGVNLATLFA